MTIRILFFNFKVHRLFKRLKLRTKSLAFNNFILMVRRIQACLIRFVIKWNSSLHLILSDPERLIFFFSYLAVLDSTLLLRVSTISRARAHHNFLSFGCNAINFYWWSFYFIIFIIAILFIIIWMLTLVLIFLMMIIFCMNYLPFYLNLASLISQSRLL